MVVRRGFGISLKSPIASPNACDANHTCAARREDDRRNSRASHGTRVRASSGMFAMRFGFMRVVVMIVLLPFPARRPAGQVLEETDPDLVAVEPDALAAAMRAPGLRQHQEELLHVDPVDRAVDGQLGAGVGNVPDAAITLPGSV